jgi:CrcB protein
MLFLSTGICGGFTTFSTFSNENVQLIRQGQIGLALLYILGSVLLGMAAVFLGYQIGKENM